MHASDTTNVREEARVEALPPLPAINVHFFAETPQGAHLFREVAADRLLRRPHVEIYEGGIPAAISLYENSPSPELLVLESTADRDSLFAQLAALAEVVMPHTQVVVIGHVNDLYLYRDLLREGVRDYLAMPLASHALLTSLAGIFTAEAKSPIGRIAAFLGAKGGVGSSTIAHNVSWLLSNRYKLKTALADLDLAFGTAGLDFEVSPAQGILDALANSDRLDSNMIDRLLHKCSEHLMLLASPCSLENVVPIEEQELARILDVMREVVAFTVLDLPSTWNNWMRAAVIQAETLVVTTTPELAALRNAKILLENIRSLRPNEKPPLVVINQVDENRPQVPPEQVAATLGVEDWLTIPFAPDLFAQASLEGHLVLEEAPDSEVARACEIIAARIAGIPSKEKEGASAGHGLLAPLLEKLRSLRK